MIDMLVTIYSNKFEGSRGYNQTFSRIMQFPPPTTQPVCITAILHNVKP